MNDNFEKASLLEAAKCREIVAEILNFGVNQNQILVLIKLLAMELEKRDIMISIVNAIENGDSHIHKNDIVI